MWFSAHFTDGLFRFPYLPACGGTQFRFARFDTFGAAGWESWASRIKLLQWAQTGSPYGVTITKAWLGACGKPRVVVDVDSECFSGVSGEFERGEDGGRWRRFPLELYGIEIGEGEGT